MLFRSRFWRETRNKELTGSLNPVPPPQHWTRALSIDLASTFFLWQHVLALVLVRVCGSMRVLVSFLASVCVYACVFLGMFDYVCL